MAKGALRDGEDVELADDTDEVVDEGGVVPLLLLACRDTETELALPELVNSPSSGKEVIMTRKMTDTVARLRMS